MYQSNLKIVSSSTEHNNVSNGHQKSSTARRTTAEYDASSEISKITDSAVHMRSASKDWRIQAKELETKTQDLRLRVLGKVEAKVSTENRAELHKLQTKRTKRSISRTATSSKQITSKSTSQNETRHHPQKANITNSTEIHVNSLVFLACYCALTVFTILLEAK